MSFPLFVALVIVVSLATPFVLSSVKPARNAVVQACLLSVLLIVAIISWL
jgi:hypothetical protein